MKKIFEKMGLSSSKNIELDSAGDLDCLASETLLHVFSFLSPKELSKMRLVSKKTKAFSEDDSLWKPHCKSEPTAGKNYREEYIEEEEALLYAWQTDPKFVKDVTGSLIVKYVLICKDDMQLKLINKYRGAPIGFRLIGDRFFQVNYTSENQYKLSIQLCDTYPHYFRDMATRAYYLNNICCAIIVVDMELQKQWVLENIRDNLNIVSSQLENNPSLVIAVIGAYRNENNILLNSEELKQLATDNNISLCFSTNLSCKEQIDVIFKQINETVIAAYHLFSKKIEPEGHTCRMM